MARTWTALCALLAAAAQVQAAEQAQARRGQGTVTLLWPTHFSSLSLSPRSASEADSHKALEPWAFGEELKNIGVKRHQEYLEATLPKELKADPGFAEGFHQMDHSRVNMAFEDWQKRVFADHEGIRIENLTQRGFVGPAREGVDYTWPELYESGAFKQLRTRIAELSRLYLQRTGHKDLPDRFRIFVWVEVFNRGDAQRPRVRTDGAYLTGRYFAAAQEGAQKLSFEDTRGINPPYGKTYSHGAYQGNLAMFPTWASHFITPNMFDAEVVCYSFLVYPPDGSSVSWGDDLTTQIKLTSPIKNAPKKQKA